MLIGGGISGVCFWWNGHRTQPHGMWAVSAARERRSWFKFLGGGRGSELGRNGQRQAGAVGGAPVARIPAKRWPARTKLETAASVFVFIGRFGTLV